MVHMKQKVVWTLTIVVTLILCIPFCTQPAAFASQGDDTSSTTFFITDLDSFKEAVVEIQALRDESGLTEATIVFTQDLEFDYVPHADVDAGYTSSYDSQFVGRNYFSGIEGVTLTLTSESDPVTLSNLGATLGSTRLTNAGFNTNDQNARFFTGPLVLDKIRLETSTRDFYFAQGFPLVITENFQSTTRISLVGGCLGTLRRLDGHGFPDSSGLGGGYEELDKTNNYPASTHLEIYGGDYSDIIGGGYNSDVTGTFNENSMSYDGGTYVKIQMDGVTEKDGWYEVANVYGGSYVRWNGSSQPSDATNGKIQGDTQVEVLSGVVASIWGGSDNLVSGRKNQGVIVGDTHVIVGTESGSSEAVCQYVYGGGSCSTIGQERVFYDPDDSWAFASVGGDTHVTINATTRGRDNVGDPSGHIYAAGDRDIINGTTSLVLNGGAGFEWVFAGGTNSNYRDETEINNMRGEPNAASIEINGGTWDEIYSGVCTFVGSSDEKSEQPINGDVFVQFNDGTVNFFSLSSPMTKIDGDSTLEINGGTLGNLVCAISGYRDTDWGGNDLQWGEVTGKRIVNLHNQDQMTCWQIYAIDEINVINTAPFIARGTTSSGALQSCGDVNLLSGTLALTGTNNLIATGADGVTGDLTIAQGATLALNGTDSVITTPGCVNAAGSAEGTAGRLLVVKPSASSSTGWVKTDMTPHRPAVGEVYLRSNSTNETAASNSDAALIDLGNNEPDLYVEYTQDADAVSSYSHAWRIAEGEIQEVTWYYEVYYQNPDGTFTLWKNAQGGKTLPTQTVSISHASFDGTDLGWGEVLGEHYVFDDGNPLNRLSAPAGEATKDNPLKIYYKCTPHTVTYQYDGSVPAGAPDLPAQVETYYSAEVATAAAPVLAGYSFSGWTVASPDGTDIENGILTMPNEDVVLTGSWTPLPSGSLTVQKQVTGSGASQSEAFPFEVTIEGLNGTYGGLTFANGVATFSLRHGESVTAGGLPVGARYTVRETDSRGYTPSSTGETGTIAEGIESIVAFTNHKDTPQVVEIFPENVTIYTGGVGGTGENHDFPYPIYLIKDEQGTVSAAEETLFQVNGTGSHAADDLFEVRYYQNGNEVGNDKIYGDLTAQVVLREAFADGTVTTQDGRTVSLGSGTLRIRYVSDFDAASDNALTISAVYYNAESQTEAMQTVEATGKAGVLLPASTRIYLNGNHSYVKSGTANIGLLFDQLLPDQPGGDNFGYTLMLLQHAQSRGYSMENTKAELRYLDLVDLDNSDAWVGSSGGCDVFWPYPEGTGRETVFLLLHFTGLHREYRMNGISLPDQVEASGVEEVAITRSENGIWFHIPESGFSPFALIWPEKSVNPTVTPTATPAPASQPPQTGDSSHSGLWLVAFLASGAVLLLIRRRLHHGRA